MENYHIKVYPKILYSPWHQSIISDMQYMVDQIKRHVDDFSDIQIYFEDPDEVAFIELTKDDLGSAVAMSTKEVDLQATANNIRHYILERIEDFIEFKEESWTANE